MTGLILNYFLGIINLMACLKTIKLNFIFNMLESINKNDIKLSDNVF